VELQGRVTIGCSSFLFT